MSFAKRQHGSPQGDAIHRQWRAASQLIEDGVRKKLTLGSRLLAAVLIDTRCDQKTPQLTENKAQRPLLIDTKSLFGKPVFLLICCSAFLCLCRYGLAAQKAAEQSDVLQRSFSVAEVRQYRIELIVRSELEGEDATRIGAKTYVSPFTRGAEEMIAWRATRRVVAIGPDGAAEVEETLDNFVAGDKKTFGPANAETEKLAHALEATLAHWTEPGARTLRYREARSGELHGLAPDGVPSLGEAAPPVLTLWMLRALRPAALLPARPIVFGDRWQEPRFVKLDAWSDLRAQESGEWMEAPATAMPGEPSARLLTVRQISGTVASGSEKPPEGAARARFHAESLVTLSLGDARVLEATRSATREISWTLAPVAGLEKPPEFRTRLAAQINIKECHGPCLDDSDDRAVVSPRK